MPSSVKLASAILMVSLPSPVFTVVVARIDRIATVSLPTPVLTFSVEIVAVLAITTSALTGSGAATLTFNVSVSKPPNHRPRWLRPITLS